MKILGIDPGLATVGIGVIEKCEHDAVRLVDFCTIETAAGLPAPARLRELAEDLTKLLRQHKPDLAVVEKLYFATNARTAMGVAEARGVVLLTLERAGVPVFEPTPLELKAAVTGDGKADKRQVRDMLLRILKVPTETFAGGKDDATDAVALAVYGAVRCGGTDGTCPERSRGGPCRRAACMG